jgi:3-hydroxyisobutyrate dehydrogenase-like beta-hydroxyacid dehydrogenase
MSASSQITAVLHPGEMGAVVGQCLTLAGQPVLWAGHGRSQDSAARASAAGLRDAGTVPEIMARARVIFSVCPPHAALDVARQVRGFTGTYVDANAIAPGTAEQVAAIVSEGGARYVDGGIIGPPPQSAGSTRLYLSGPGATEVAGLFAGSPLDARAVEGALTAASAVKMAYAGWTKGSSALLLAIRALARAGGVEDTLLAEWGLSQPGLEAQSGRAARAASAKGWRWAGEMDEIAAAMAAAGLPAGFHQGAAWLYRQVPRPAGRPADGAAAGSDGAAAGGDGAAAGSDGAATGGDGRDVAGSGQSDAANDGSRVGDQAVEQILSLLTSPATTAKAPPRG